MEVKSYKNILRKTREVKGSVNIDSLAPESTPHMMVPELTKERNERVSFWQKKVLRGRART